MLRKKHVIKTWIVPMTSVQTPLGVESTLPDHRQLPESDGTFVFAERAGGKNLQEHPQSLFRNAWLLN